MFVKLRNRIFVILLLLVIRKMITQLFCDGLYISAVTKTTSSTFKMSKTMDQEEDGRETTLMRKRALNFKSKKLNSH